VLAHVHASQCDIRPWRVSCAERHDRLMWIPPGSMIDG
jgi:hypothetical protein